MSLLDIKSEVMEDSKYYAFSGFYSDRAIWEIMIENIENKGEIYDIDETNKTLLIWFSELKALYSNKNQRYYLKLDAVFKRLNNKEIITLHNAGKIMEEGFDEINEIAAERVEQGIRTVGCCFYCENDIISMYENQDKILRLSFGSYYEHPNATEIGEIISDMLIEFGFNVNWNHLADKKIEITDFIWDKLYVD